MIAAWIILFFAVLACADLIANGRFSDLHDCISGTVWTIILFCAAWILFGGAYALAGAAP